MACTCEVVEIEDGFDGFFYHKECGLQIEGMRATANENDDLLTPEDLKRSVRRRVNKPEARSKPSPKFWATLEDGIDPTYPDNPSSEDDWYYCYTEFRKTYVMGIQIMIELQIKALVEDFKVCPIIIDMIEPVWLRFVDSTELLSDKWAKKVIKDTKSELKGRKKAGEHKGKKAREHKGKKAGEHKGEIKTGEHEGKEAGEHKGKPRNILSKRIVSLWYRSLRNKIPLSCSLAISFLACHLAREPILSTDIIKWALEGKLPYFAAFVEVNKLLELPTIACPLTSSHMFRPALAINIQKLEALAASIAQSIELELPPVNFSAIASRYLKQLSLPVNIILPHACRIYEWSMPPELWLSANELLMVPTHAFILCILIVSIRILYNIHGFGMWEMSLSCGFKGNNVDEVLPQCISQSEADDDDHDGDDDDDCDDYAAKPCKKDLDATKILVLLQSKYNELIDASDHAMDLEAYLEYCEGVVFASVELSYKDQDEDKKTKALSNNDQEEDKKIKVLSYGDQQEDEIINDFWQFYKEKKPNHKPSESCFLRTSSLLKIPRDHSQSIKNMTKKPKDDNVQVTLDPKESHKDREIRRMKSNMKENRFCYIPPRKRVKRLDYLHYSRRKGDGGYVYAAHADYYILLRSCARVAQINVRSMHAAVLSFERRLGWLEKNIQHSFKQMDCNEDCELCHPSSSLIYLR